MKEGTGGENLAVAWRKPGDLPLQNGDPPIPGAFLSSTGSVDPGTIVGQPESRTVDEFGSVSFTVALSGTPPFDYQWYQNDVPINAASGPILTIAAAAFADNQAQFRVRAGNGISSQLSDAALLKVVPDLTPPVLLAAEGSPSLDRVTLRFSEPIEAADALEPSHYAIDGGLTVLGLAGAPEGHSVVLTTSPQTPGQAYRVTVNGLHDLAAARNSIAVDSNAGFTAFVWWPGYLQREVFESIPGQWIADLTSHWKFPELPDRVSQVSLFEAPRTGLNDFGVRLRGHLLPPVTGDYVFYLSARREGRLFLSTDDSPANAVMIAWDSQWYAERLWIEDPLVARPGPINISAPVPLEAGRKYYVEAWMKEAYEGGSLGVNWQLPGEPPPENGSAPIGGAFLGCYVNPLGQSINFVAQPGPLVVPEGENTVLQVRVEASSPDITYQWQRNGIDIPGATQRQFFTSTANLRDDLSRYRCLVTIPGLTVASEEAILTVTPDSTPPTVLGAEGSVRLTKVTVRFSEPIRPDDATDPSHYSLSDGLVAESARLRFDGKTVVLTTSPQTSGHDYVLTLNGIRDAAAAGNAIAPNTHIHFVGWESEEFVGPFSSWMDLKHDFGAAGDGVADDTEALQAALDQVGSSQLLGLMGDPLFIPAGTYRISRRLELFTRYNFIIAGEDPKTTIILWDGPEDGVMFWSNGATMGKVTRLTWDGAGKAFSAIDHKWDMQRSYATSFNEYSDMIFRGVKHGIRGGLGWNDAEVSVLRCQFLGCTEAAIRTDSFNSVNWWVWDSLFDGCKVGFMNPGGGAAHFYRCLLRNSTYCDIWLQQCSSFFSYRWNTSIGSKALLEQWCGGPLTLQGNQIIDPLDTTPIRLGARVQRFSTTSFANSVRRMNAAQSSKATGRHAAGRECSQRGTCPPLGTHQVNSVFGGSSTTSAWPPK